MEWIQVGNIAKMERRDAEQLMAKYEDWLVNEKKNFGKNKWMEFCEKTGLDPKIPPKDRVVKIIFEEV